MKVLVMMLSFAAFASSASAFPSWQAECGVVQSTIRGLATAQLSGPVNEYDYHLSLLDRDGRQIDAGICQFSGMCFAKDGKSSAVRAQIRNGAGEGKFELRVQTDAGVALMACVRR